MVGKATLWFIKLLNVKVFDTVKTIEPPLLIDVNIMKLGVFSCMFAKGLYK